MKSMVTLLLGGLALLVARADASESLRIGFPEGLPGYELSSSGDFVVKTPYKKALTQCVLENLQRPVVWSTYPTNRILSMLQNNDLDLIYPMGFTDERASKMLQSEHVWENWDYFLSLKPVDPTDKSLRIGARHGSPQHTDYQVKGYERITPSYSYEDLIHALNRGLVDVVIVPQSVFEQQRADWPANVRSAKGQQRNTGFYLNQADPQRLLAPLNRAIQRCRARVPAQ